MDTGDINGDGWIDFVFGNSQGFQVGAANVAFLGNGRSPEPAWTSFPAARTFSVELTDIDADGDLDLACGNSFNDGDVIYENVGGELSTFPAWDDHETEGLRRHTSCIALSDLDRDGDRDFVLGQHSGVRVVSNLREDYWRLLDGRFPASDPHLEDIAIASGNVDVNRAIVRFQAVDEESEPLYVIPQYQFAGEGLWRSIDPVRTRFGPYGATPSGVRDSLEWNTQLVPEDPRPIVLRLRSQPVHHVVGVVRSSAAFVHVPPDLPRESGRISISAGALEFGTVTLGDTVAVPFGVSNIGGTALTIESIRVPSFQDPVRPGLVDRAWVGPDTTAIIEPGEATDFALYLAPKKSLGLAGPLVINSDDPFTPNLHVDVVGTIVDLVYRTQLFALDPMAVPLGEALTIQAILEGGARADTGYVHFRQPADEPWQFAPLARLSYSDESAQERVAQIPGEFVTEAGLEFTLELFNGEVRQTDPDSADVGVYHQIATVPAEVIGSRLIGDVVESGAEVLLQVLPQQGSVLTSAFIHYRAGGDPTYQTDPIGLADPDNIVAPIPSEVIGPSGVQYWISASTLLSDRVTDPPQNPENQPHTFQVEVGNLQEPGDIPDRYRMASVPLVFHQDVTLEDLLADDSFFGSYDPVNWRSFRYLPDLAGYSELGGAGSDSLHQLAPGRAVWLRSRQPAPVTTDPVVGLSTPLSPAAITLEWGWNQIGNPFTFPVEWEDVRIDGVPILDAHVNGVVSLPRTDVGWIVFEDSRADSTMKPFSGYWLKNVSAGGEDVTLTVPPVSATKRTSSRELTLPISWIIGIEASADELSQAVTMMASPIGSEGLDAMDEELAPPAPGSTLRTFIPLLDDRGFRRLTADARPDPVEGGTPAVWGLSWPVIIEVDEGDETPRDIILDLYQRTRLPRDARVVLIDRWLDTSIDLGDVLQYRTPLRPPTGREQPDIRFQVLVGTSEFVAAGGMLPGPPIASTLRPPGPNPLRTATLIRYDLAHSGGVAIRVFDIGGRLVRELANDWHTVGRYANLVGRTGQPRQRRCRWRLLRGPPYTVGSEVATRDRGPLGRDDKRARKSRGTFQSAFRLTRTGGTTPSATGLLGMAPA